jgi:hypothetical protein
VVIAAADRRHADRDDCDSDHDADDSHEPLKNNARVANVTH